jgi:hypothetical protein
MVGSETGDEGAAMDVVKRYGEHPVVFCVVDFEAAVLGNAVGSVLVWNRVGREVTNYSGWMGLKSVPTTLADGYAFARMLVSLQISRDRGTVWMSTHQNQWPNYPFQSRYPKHCEGPPPYSRLVQHVVFHPKQEA